MPSRKFKVCATFQDTMPPGRIPQLTSESPNSALIRRERAIASTDLREAAAEAVAVDHGDGRLREIRESVPAPLIGRVARFRPLRRRVIISAEIKLDVLAGAEGLPRTGKHENVGLRIDSEFGERVVHLEMELRAHGVALVRTVHDQPRD